MGIGKIVAGISFTTIATTAGVGSFYYLTSESTFEELLKQEKPARRILANNDKDKASKAWDKYKEDNKPKGTNKDNDEWKLSVWNSKHSANETPEELITKCTDKIKNKAKNKEDKSYKQFLDWCTVTTTT